MILFAAALLIGGYLFVKVKMDEEARRLAEYNAQMELSKLQEQAEKDRKEQEDKPKPPPPPEQMQVPEERATQKLTPPEIKKDELVKEENQMK